MKQPASGIQDALDQILDQINGSFAQAERRLAEKMAPARLAPVHFTNVNGRVASGAIIAEIRREQSLHTQTACA